DEDFRVHVSLRSLVANILDHAHHAKRRLLRIPTPIDEPSNLRAWTEHSRGAPADHHAWRRAGIRRLDVAALQDMRANRRQISGAHGPQRGNRLLAHLIE